MTVFYFMTKGPVKSHTIYNPNFAISLTSVYYPLISDIWQMLPGTHIHTFSSLNTILWKKVAFLAHVDTVNTKAKQYQECETLITRIEVRIMRLKREG